jgi:aspartate carbamoyltransferase catalytic subunit
MLEGRHLLDPTDFSPGELSEILDFADQIIQCPAQVDHLCDSSILATLFYKPSTRTRFSFEAAMLRLGGTATFVRPTAMLDIVCNRGQSCLL